MPRYRVSYLTEPKSVRDAISERPDTPIANAYYGASFGMSPNFMVYVSRAIGYGLYRRVINLNAKDMEEVFDLCNSKDVYWPDAMPEEANAVFLDGKAKLRSMSVGDLIDDGGGNYWVVASFGFEPINPEFAASACL